MQTQRILVVEDERIVSLDLCSRLKRLGFEVASTASTGDAAVEAALELKPDLILMDIVLEGQTDGIQAAEIIRGRAEVPIIYLTAYADEKTLDRAKLTGPEGYIIKPPAERELKMAIEVALYKHGMEAKLEQNRRWLATTLESIGDAVLATDNQGRVVFLNRAAAGLLDCGQDSAKGRPLAEVFRLRDPETGLDAEHLVKGILANNPALGLGQETLLLTPGGREVPVSLKAAAIHNANNGKGGMVLVIRDISEEKRGKEALKNSLNMLRQTLHETVAALAAMGEKRDPYTAGHQARVSLLACAIAEEMGLEPDRLEGLGVAGSLHDIGKIYVPAEILSKPSALTNIERSLVKSHPEVGYEILKTVSFPWPVARIVRQHHERLNGSGYPDGLLGDQILLEARILAVADVVEAMSSHRPYRAALGIDKALDEINAKRGVLYEPEAVDICLDLFREKGFTFKRDEPGRPGRG
ncbi:MAG: HD domain-containing protein [Desulfovibrionaceae bacterium]|nr:HD domain-containing protein [Desulfovibrionaceae bacterium]